MVIAMLYHYGKRILCNALHLFSLIEVVLFGFILVVLQYLNTCVSNYLIFTVLVTTCLGIVLQVD